MSRIFISYRRDDSAGYAIALYKQLSEHFGAEQIFMDIDTIEPGLDFVEVIEQAVGSCDALVALIGKQWLTLTDEAGNRRLDDPYDFVRLEIATALERNVRVIPALVRDAPMPRAEDLPDALKALARRNALELSDQRFDHDVARLIEVLEKVLGVTESTVPRRGLVPKTAFTLPMLEWVDIPAGWVTIEDEDPDYRKEFHVEFFRISKYPVTYAQFQAFLNAPDGFRNDVWWEGLAKRATEPGRQAWPVDNHPRENVSWCDAVAFCRWLSKKIDLAISLPTEQQWQRAAQGDDGREYPWGNRFASSRCNTGENGISRTTPVDQYPNGASPYGVCDMAGNVWEWCLNEWENPENTGLAGDAIRVLHGGSWRDDQSAARCTYRLVEHPGDRGTSDGDYGFRVVCVPPSS
jgi:formylglycine-generating enzyme required for sulfatase activity